MISALVGGERAPGSHWIGGWIGPRAGLEAVEKGKNISTFPRIEPGRPTHNKLLHRLSYPGYGIPYRLEYSNTEWVYM
jgi:hypothetical protein